MRRPAAILRRVVARWQLGNSASARDRFSEDGDTLIEVLLSVVVLGIAAVALLTGFATAITASAEHRHLASLDSSTRIAANEAIADVQQQAQNPANNPFLCANTFTPTFTNLTGSFTVTSTVLYWNGSGWGSGCTNYAPQQYTLTVTATGSGADSTVVTTVIYDPSAPPPPNGVGTPVQLVWLQQPTSGTVGTPVTPQPEVAVEDALNNIVTSDLSSVTLVVVSGPGTFSSTCSGVESYGIVQFSDCSLNAAGTYTIKAVDSTSSVGATPTTSLTVTGAPVAKLVFTTAAVSGTASNTANLGPITVQEQDAFGNPTFAPETVNLSSSSAKGVFSLTAGGAPVTSVTIPGGAVSSVSFYYGDTIAGSPTITASSPPAVGLASGTQTETIKAGPAATFSLSTPSPTAGTAFNETITAFDQFGNTATGFTGTQCITFSGPANSPNGNVPAYPARGTCAIGSSSVTFAAGVGTASITLYKAGSTTLTATQGTVSGSVTFTVATGTLGVLSVANPGTQTAGTAFNVAITGTDAYGNAFSGTVTPTFSGPATSPNGTAPTYPASVTFTNGSATASVTLYDAQTTTLRVASGAVNGTSPSFIVNAGPLAGFTLSTPTATAGTPFTETITAGDAYGNGGAAYTGTKCITFSGPANSPNGNAPAYPAPGGTCGAGTSAVTFNASGVGTASITLFKAGSTTLTATQGTISGSVTFTVSSGTVKTFTIPTTPNTQTAGTAFNVTIDATDTYGNPFGGTLTTGGSGLAFSGPANSPAPSNTAPSYPTSLTFTNGAATANMTLYDAQSTTLTVGATGATSATTPASFTVNPGAASKFTLSTPTPTAGTPFTETITAIDAYANTATGFTGTECVAFSGPANSPNNTVPGYPAKGACATGSSLTFAAGIDNSASITLYRRPDHGADGHPGPHHGQLGRLHGEPGQCDDTDGNVRSQSVRHGQHCVHQQARGHRDGCVRQRRVRRRGHLRGAEQRRERNVRSVQLQPAGVLVHPDHRRKRAGHIVDLHGQRHQRCLHNHGIRHRTHLSHVRGSQQGEPDHHLHHDGAGQRRRRWRHLHAGGHRHLGPGGDHHRRRVECGCLLHQRRRRGELHGPRHLHARRQPGRQRAPGTRRPRSSRASRSSATRPSPSPRRRRAAPSSVAPTTRRPPPPPRAWR